MTIAVLFILAAVNVESEIDILAQSTSGKVLCVNPDSATKTCSAISSYSTAADGSVVETTEVLLSPGQPLTLTMSIKAEVTGGSNCGVMTLYDLRRGQVRMNGEDFPADRNALALKRIEASMGSLAGIRACEVIRSENGGLVKYGQVDGADLKLPGKPVRWVASQDGYKVSPTS